VDAAVRGLHEETGLILTPEDLTLLSDALVRVALPEGLQLVYVYSASVPVLFATSHLRTPAQVEQAVTTQSTINPDGTYVVPESINIDGLNLTPAKTGLLRAEKHKSEILHFGYVTPWETFVEQSTHTARSFKTTRLFRDSSSCSPGLRRSTLVMFGC
jgi:ADP-ribose pyrophosphatase YjhB (NUDIX family)